MATGAGWIIEVPAQWNGTLCLFSHGYGEFGPGGPADAAGSPRTRETLLRLGYALAASTYAREGWAIASSVQDQIDVIEEFHTRIGTPDVVIAWGRSMGGLVTAAFAQLAPDAVDAAVPMCASLAGPIPMLNQGLDGAFALSTLAGRHIPLVGDRLDDRARWEVGRDMVQGALQDPTGRARFALAAAVSQMPTWTDGDMDGIVSDSPEPAPGDHEAALHNQAKVFHFAAFSPRLDMERRAGGVFSWNDGVDYAAQLAASGFSDIVSWAYERAGASLDDDLARLADAPRISADPAAVAAMEQDLTPDGGLGIPVLTVSLTGDYAPTVTQTAAYRDVVADAGNADLLRQAFVRGPGHCAFSTAEITTAIRVAEERVRTGAWPDTDASALNERMTDTTRASTGRATSARFIDHSPVPHVRPYPRANRITPLSHPKRRTT